MNVRFSALAQQDLDDIFTYIHDTLHNPTAAHNTVKGIIGIAAHLSNFPKLGAVVSLPNSVNLVVRYVLFSNYLIAYVVEASHVSVIRIIYARSDYLRLLGE